MKCRTSLVHRKASPDQPVAAAQVAPFLAPQDAADAPGRHGLLEDATAIHVALQAYENWSGRQDPEALREARAAFDTLKQGCARLTERLRRHRPG
ncbi:hypothetical protein CA234_14190 [Sphingomonas sp. ABOLE]|uniref:hypothetical protein n=1 Tax=Sphingomonas sp. ABOLE TaxID=1985878 RepID=UPI000F7DC31D|nr:hypothetical protein [Sphingomonas sp. ABOLE]RSV39727.1 hypothetical protein CA234_14190 [Sphingomonas sp. ABOLE]